MSDAPHFVPDPSAPVQLPSMILMPLRDTIRYRRRMKTRSAKVPVKKDSDFKLIWVKNKRAFLERGFYIAKSNGAWTLYQLLQVIDGKYALTDIGKEKLKNIWQTKLELPDEKPVALECEPLPASLNEKLFPYQQPAAAQLWRALRKGRSEYGYDGALDASEMGTGKTYQGLAAALALGRPVGVICRHASIPDWKRAFEHFGHTSAFIHNYESLRTGNREPVRRIDHKINGKEITAFVWQYDPHEITFIFDEVQSCRKASTLNTGLLEAAITLRAPILGLSGTVAENPTQLPAIGRFLGLHAGGDSYNQFLASHGCIQTGAKTFIFPRGRRAAFHLAKIHRTLFPFRGARTRKKDLGDTFPEKRVLRHDVTNPEIERLAIQYSKLFSDIEKLRKLGASPNSMDAEQRRHYMKARKEVEMSKVPEIVDHAKQALEEGYSVPIFLNFNDSREAVMTAFGTDCGVFGGQNEGERRRHIDAFQANEKRVIVVNAAAGGAGISLHDIHGGHARYSIVSPSDNATEANQVIDRIHRAGSQSPATIAILCAAGTIDIDSYRRIIRKSKQIATINDGKPSSF